MSGNGPIDWNLLYQQNPTFTGTQGLMANLQQYQDRQLRRETMLKDNFNKEYQNQTQRQSAEAQAANAQQETQLRGQEINQTGQFQQGQIQNQAAGNQIHATEVQNTGQYQQGQLANEAQRTQIFGQQVQGENSYRQGLLGIQQHEANTNDQRVFNEELNNKISRYVALKQEGRADDAHQFELANADFALKKRADLQAAAQSQNPYAAQADVMRKYGEPEAAAKLDEAVTLGKKLDLEYGKSALDLEVSKDSRALDIAGSTAFQYLQQIPLNTAKLLEANKQDLQAKHITLDQFKTNVKQIQDEENNHYLNANAAVNSVLPSHLTYDDKGDPNYAKFALSQHSVKHANQLDEILPTVRSGVARNNQERINTIVENSNRVNSDIYTPIRIENEHLNDLLNERVNAIAAQHSGDLPQSPLAPNQMQHVNPMMPQQGFPVNSAQAQQLMQQQQIAQQQEQKRRQLLQQQQQGSQIGNTGGYQPTLSDQIKYRTQGGRWNLQEGPQPYWWQDMGSK